MTRRRFPLCAVSAVLSSLLLAAAAHSATVTVTMPRFVDFGSSFEVTITADSEGDPGQLISITLIHDTSFLSSSGATQPADLFTQANGAFGASRGGLEGTCGGVFGANGCNAFDQILGNFGPIDAGPKQATLSYFVAGVSSVITNDHAIDVTGGFGLKTIGTGAFEFAGLDASEVVFTFVPEPAAATSVGLGLLGLALGRHLRRRLS